MNNRKDQCVFGLGSTAPPKKFININKHFVKQSFVETIYIPFSSRI